MTTPLHILLVDDEEVILETLSDYLRDAGHRVEEARNGSAALQAIEKVEYDLALVDLRMPGMDGLALLAKIQELHPDLPVVILTGHGTLETAIQALRLGAADFLTKPAKMLELEAVVEKAIRLRRLRQERSRLRQTIGNIQAATARHARSYQMVGISQAATGVREQILQAVEANCQTILITGETGTGKEVVAHQIHFHAHADHSPFIALSCPTLPEGLVESELFGHVKGAFTGAIANQAGYFELARGGTLFLDEVADLSAAAQAKLLRVLETRAFRRVGGDQEIHVDLRVIAATNTALEALMEAGRFRRDLFYRLNSYPIHLLPLRERREDILPLAEHFLSRYAAQRNLHFAGFSEEAKGLLMGYSFPGNVRELCYLVERAALLCRSGQLQAEHFNLPPQAAVSTTGIQIAGDPEHTRILQALEAAHWNRRQAARDLGIPYSTLRYKMRTFGIE